MPETKELYYSDSHIRSFTSLVERCRPHGDLWEVVLEETAFYPGGGGQDCDLGTIGEAKVLGVDVPGSYVVHYCDRPVEVGSEPECRIDWHRRFDLMQQHTGEHMVSGVIHRRYGYHNTGFHMGSDVITIDFDGVIPVEDLSAIEAEVNAGIWQDLAVKCWYPEPEELPHVTYRTKKELPWPVRIVEIPGFDKCACCGIHVKRTGEVGLVKIFSAMGFRGGSRLEMACGNRAVAMLNHAFDQNRQVSQAFSAKITETGAAARRMNQILEQEKLRYGQLQQRLFREIAESYVNCSNVLHFEEGLEPVQIRILADIIAEVCGGCAAVFSGTDEAGYGFAMVAREGDLRQLGREMTGRLSGRGGGKPNYQQGRVQATREEIEIFFREGKR